MTKVLHHPTNKFIWNKRIFAMREDVVKELKESIKKDGLIQPIVAVVSREDEDGLPEILRLIVGRKRYQAVKELYAEDPLFKLRFAGEAVPWGTIPTIDFRDLDPALLLNIEVAENVVRMDLTWRDKVAALAELHARDVEDFERKKIEGIIPANATHSINDLSKRLAAKGGNQKTIHTNVCQALIVASQLDNPEVAKADSLKGALNVIKHNQTLELKKLRPRLSDDSAHKLVVGDCVNWMGSTLRSETFDLIIADPPYGIKADTYQNMREHKYDDSWGNAATIYDAICTYGFGLTAERANLILFCSPENWHHIRDLAEEAGWTPWYRPLIWKKSNEGMRPLGQIGFAYTYECVMFATKGNKWLNKTSNDVFDIYRPHHTQREHAAAKPVELYKHLMDITCLPGDKVLDPCVGSGTSFKAGTLLGLQVTGIELNEEIAKLAEANRFWLPGDDAHPNDNINSLEDL